jgi:hypothetical protein
MIGLSKQPDTVIDEYYSGIAGKIKKRALSVRNSGLKRGAGPALCPNLEEQQWIDDIFEEEFLRGLICAEPEKLKEELIRFIGKYPSSKDPHSNFNTFLYNIFVSTGYSRLLDKWKVINYSGVLTCPYCNRHYTTSLNKQKRVKPEIDHFYPKAKYPFLALSFYNLIPSCSLCNGYACKHENDPVLTGLTSPYNMAKGAFKFTFSPLTSDILSLGGIEKSLKINVESKHIANIEVFKLEELYQTHKDHVGELILRSKIKYSDIYRKYLDSYSGLSLTKAEIDRMILGNYSLEEELHKRPLSKLYSDIGRELGLIE